MVELLISAYYGVCSQLFCVLHSVSPFNDAFQLISFIKNVQSTALISKQPPLSDCACSSGLTSPFLLTVWFPGDSYKHAGVMASSDEQMLDVSALKNNLRIQD